MTERKPARPQGDVLEALRGKVSGLRTVISHKPGNEGPVQIRVAEKGAALIDLKDRADNQEWAGVFNQLLTSTRIAVYLAENLKQSGVDIDTNVVLNTGLLMYTGKRMGDESKWYPDIQPYKKIDVVGDTIEKADEREQDFAHNLLTAADVPSRFVENIEAHRPSRKIEDMNLESRLVLYSVWRTAGKVMPLQERFEDFRKRAVPERYREDDFEEKVTFFTGFEKEIFSKLDMNPEDITNNNPPQPLWERYLRRLYINDVEEKAFSHKNKPWSAYLDRLKMSDPSTFQIFQESMARTRASWWGSSINELYANQDGKPYKSNKGKPEGMNRAIEFFNMLDRFDPDPESKTLFPEPSEK